MTKNIHIICFDVPFPANYGGAMEEFYKIKGLHQLGVNIILHCFTYNDRIEQNELNQYCNKIYYYKRDTSFTNLLSKIPFVVKSRANEALLQNLLQDDYPILFDATHTTYFINHEKLKNRKKIIRLHNIEWIYYNTLFHSEFSIKSLLYFYSEYKKLRNYDAVFEHADILSCLSTTDYDYYKNKFPEKNIHFIPVFHPNETINCKTGKGNYILYHGNLSVIDNYASIISLLENELKDIDFPIKIAGKNPDQSLINFVKNKSNIQLIPNPTDDELQTLIQNAQCCLAVAGSPTGVKLKLVNTLFNGRFCLSNEGGCVGSNLENQVLRIDECDTTTIEALLQQNFTQQNLLDRQQALLQYHNLDNAQQLINHIFN
ncbi:MAG: glycosyltransferase [Chitinophagales bacterium]|nr:glycosyltransferase [Chitinophagales bacterium]